MESIITVPPSSNDADHSLPSYIKVMDRIEIKFKLSQAKFKEEQAKEVARFYRDHCAQLKGEVLKIKSTMAQLKAQNQHEKNQIHYFWRNKIIEGQSRSGRILRLGLDIANNKVMCYHLYIYYRWKECC